MLRYMSLDLSYGFRGKSARHRFVVRDCALRSLGCKEIRVNGLLSALAKNGSRLWNDCAKLADAVDSKVLIWHKMEAELDVTRVGDFRSKPYGKGL